jgi:sugar lactone lactonase YvrE
LNPAQGVQTIKYIIGISLSFFLILHGVTAWAQNVTTLTPTPFTGSGDLAVDTDGNIFVADFGPRRNRPFGENLYKVTPVGEVSVFTGGINGGTGNTFDSQGNLYQSSYRGVRIDRISPDGVVTLFAGGDQGIARPFGLTFDSQGNLFAANWINNSIVKITPGGVSTMFSQSALLDEPTGLTSDDQDNLYITNHNNGDIIKLTPAGQASLFAATSTPSGADQSGHIIFANERLYVASISSHQVFELSLAGEIKVLAGSGIEGLADGPLLEATLSQPNGIDVSPDGRLLYVNNAAAGAIFSPNVVRVIELPNIGPAFEINAGHSGAWFNPDTSGQGQFIDVEPGEQFMFLSWFTYTDAASDNPNEQQWYTAQGNYSGDTAVLDLFETLGGKFDDPQEVTTTQVGEVTLTFSDCDMGMMSYSFDAEELEGEFPLIRVIPGSDNVCEGLSGNNTQAVDINAGMDGAWFDPDTSGQGYFIDTHPDPEGGNFIFISWFTYGNATASGQRWLTAQGGFEGSTAEIDVIETTGGSFDDPEPVSRTTVGTMTIDFTDCSNAQLTYSLPADGAEGDIAITRVIPGSQAVCEELAGAH